ncbi:MAG TPA: alpha/beta hydrolase [Solirubrobacteraceae bacterium]|nr:alpha/beta hydrolase [Solirubrobacteraceae bacterium]
MAAPTRPPFDAELAPALEGLPSFFTTVDPATIADFRAATAHSPGIEEVIAGRPVEVFDHVVAGFEGGEITVSVLRRSDHADAAAPGAFLIHGGGMIGGNRWSVAPMLVEWVLEHDAVAATVEYRLAPDFSDPVPVEDCAAAFHWFVAHAGEFGFDPRRVLLGGQSAGGGLAAGTTLLARDRGASMPAALLLMWPMLDDRNDSLSARQIDGVGIWDRTSNATGWSALLGDRRGTAEVSISSAPGRATDLSGLPTVYLEAGSAEVFRDETVAFASRLWEAGGSAELHIWAGGFHGFQGIVPTAALSKRAGQTREAWVRRVLAD